MSTQGKIKYIVIHESDTPTGRHFTVEDIDSWHQERGFQRSEGARQAFNPSLKAIGYHYVIYIDGALHTGRAETEVPAAVQGHNTGSINICLIGKGKYTPDQWDTLNCAVTDILSRHPDAEVCGHCEFDTAKAQGKTCPDFDVREWFKTGMQRPAGHVA